MKQIAKWKLPTLIQYALLNQCLYNIQALVQNQSHRKEVDIFQNYFFYTFKYYPSNNGYDFQKVSYLPDCNPNFKDIWHAKHNTKQETGIISQFTFWGNKWPKSVSCHHLTQTPKSYLFFSLDWWKNYSFWNFILYIKGLFNLSTDFFSSANITLNTCLITVTSFNFQKTKAVL